MDRKGDYKTSGKTKYVIIHDVAHLLPYWWTKEFVKPTVFDLFTSRAQAEHAVTRFTKFATKGYGPRRDCAQDGKKRMPNHVRRRMVEARKYCEALERGPEA